MPIIELRFDMDEAKYRLGLTYPQIAYLLDHAGGDPNLYNWQWLKEEWSEIEDQYRLEEEEEDEQDEVDTQAAVKDPNTPSSTLTSKASTGSKEKVIPQNKEKDLKEVARNLLEEIQSGDEDDEMDEMESRVQQWIDDYPEPRK